MSQRFEIVASLSLSLRLRTRAGVNDVIDVNAGRAEIFRIIPVSIFRITEVEKMPSPQRYKNNPILVGEKLDDLTSLTSPGLMTVIEDQYRPIFQHLARVRRFVMQRA